MLNFDPGIVAIIVGAGIVGYPLNLAIKFLKKKLNVKGLMIYLIEILVCCGATASYLISIQGWNLTLFGIYSALVFASIHGYHVNAKAKAK